MQKLLFLFAICCAFLYSCEKKNIVPKKYYLEIKQYNWSGVGDSEYEGRIEEIIANNNEEAYSKGYKSYIISKRVAQATHGETASQDIKGFVVLDEYKKNIALKVPQKFKDSIHKAIDNETEYIIEDLRGRIEDHNRKKTN